MLKKVITLGMLFAIIAGVAACGSGGDDTGSVSGVLGTNTAGADSTTETIVTLDDGYADALPVSAQLAIGTLLLERTEDAVTVEQVHELSREMLLGTNRLSLAAVGKVERLDVTPEALRL